MGAPWGSVPFCISYLMERTLDAKRALDATEGHERMLRSLTLAVGKLSEANTAVTERLAAAEETLATLSQQLHENVKLV